MKTIRVVFHADCFFKNRKHLTTIVTSDKIIVQKF